MIVIEKELLALLPTDGPDTARYLKKQNICGQYILDARYGSEGEIVGGDYSVEIIEYIDGYFPQKEQPFEILNTSGEVIGTEINLENAKCLASSYLENLGASIQQGVN
tara:strand:- start:1418 stop:1741 length:324 start_codon:yes stop_codon:yes gene_type:complete